MSKSVATFAGGCFWCMVEPFDQLPGIIGVVSGYTGGHTDNPTYEEVCSHTTGHVEAVQITFDPDVKPYEELLDIFWRQIDPTDEGGQFHDRGQSYQTAIFYHNEAQKEAAEISKQTLIASDKFKQPIVTKILPAKKFYPAENNHQGYYRKNPFHYKLYKQGSGRKTFIDENWKESNSLQSREKLTPMQHHVTQENGTEPAFQNEYWDNEKEGIYIDIVSGKVLFSSIDKFDAGCGWPSFTKPVNQAEMKELIDTSHGMRRIEVRSETANSHLGHIFPDGPKEHGGMRYCMNSAAMRFIPKEKMDEMGYSAYLDLFN